MPTQSWFHLDRIPEPEVMDDRDGVEAYTASAAQAYLERIDRSFADHALRLGVAGGSALDIGTGPGLIPIMLAVRTPGLRLTGVDLSEPMLQKARDAAREAGVADRLDFRLGDAKSLPFSERSFDLVLCNSLLHHLPDPLALLNEVSRVTKPGGAILLRDLRRPSRLEFRFHAGWFGRHYSGVMRQLYQDSLRAAYTRAELEKLLHRSRLAGARVFRTGRTHIGIERAARVEQPKIDQGNREDRLT
ncbi:MAG: class I SAM-dependent methyltransferase [Acidobacteriota bacterium]|nr:class I SAM-dependent methyltransferase [Acidobacteriota bacterium]MDE2965296.1 class I SAM-dependent methyltransferase [Acidobacteriota bacterium]